MIDIAGERLLVKPPFTRESALDRAESASTLRVLSSSGPGPGILGTTLRPVGEQS
jgi:hypothetical protein